jgi:hypothetical protein
MYRTIDLIPKTIALWLNKYNIPTYCFIGKYFFMPDDNMDLIVVVGKTIELPQLPDPSEEEVNRYHRMFINAYVDLFNKYKREYSSGGENSILEVY